MWTRAELKERAKANLKKYYWMAFLVSLVFSLVSAFGGGSESSGSNDTYGTDSSYYNEVLPESLFEGNLDIVPDAVDKLPSGMVTLPGGGGTSAASIARIALGVMTGVLIVLVIISIVLAIFVIPVMEVGRNRFYMESRGLGYSAGFGKLFWGFRHHYLNIVLTMFLRSLFIGLGCILCVIPGIYLSYSYYMVPYILSENPEMKPMEVLRLSKEMMNGHKLNTWILELSFIGWILLGIIACFVGTFFVAPYIDATFAELYAVLRRPHSGRLAGFGVPDVVPVGGDSYGSYVNPESVHDAQGGWNQGNWNQGGNYSGSYGQGNWNQNGTDGGNYGQGSWGQSGTDGGNYNQGSWNQSGTGSGNYDQGGWNQSDNGGAYGAGTVETGSESPYDSDVKRSEGGPGNGYYLNGEFHPYSDDEKH